MVDRLKFAVNLTRTVDVLKSSVLSDVTSVTPTDTLIVFLDILHNPVFIQNIKVSETGFCLRLQVQRTQLGPIDSVGPYLRISAPVKTVQWIMSRITEIVLIRAYNHHRLLDFIYSGRCLPMFQRNVLPLSSGQSTEILSVSARIHNVTSEKTIIVIFFTVRT
jgi:hypothetical protein